MERLLGNIITKQLNKELVELLNGKDFDMLSPQKREYISNVYTFQTSMQKKI